MRFQTVQILNYKSFRDSGEINLDAGFNVIVGKNDAGKSALLEALSLRSEPKPHLSLSTLPNRNSVINSNCIIKVTITIASKDIANILATHKEFTYYRNIEEGADDSWNRFSSSLTSSKKFFIQFQNSKIITNESWLENYATTPTPTPVIEHPFEEGHVLNKGYPRDLLPVYSPNPSSPPKINYTEIIANAFRDRIYSFRAERLNIGECSVGTNRVLAPNASNLPEVLNILQSNPIKFDNFLEHVKAIFPHITRITIPPVDNNRVKILVWSHPIDSGRDDLAVPLSESGTGIGQVLAMLYVVVNADDPKVIIIDEPQSFLHPGAVRKLLEILQNYQENQYVITTHSPIAITATGAESLLLVKREEFESKVQKISHDDKEELETFLNDIGAKLSDIFGADQVLWVEGKTEEECFSLIIKKLLRISLSGTQILGVKSTSDLTDLKGKNAIKIFEIYNRLQSASTLLPPAIYFILDKEKRTEEQIQSINEKSGGRVEWLPRRMFENYLLDPNSIAAILNKDDSEFGSEFLAEDIQSWIEAHAQETKYFDRRKEFPQYPNTAWYEQVDGANLMKDLFGDLTDQRVSYDKVTHGRRLTEKLIENPTPDFQKLADFLKQFFD